MLKSKVDSEVAVIEMFNSNGISVNITQSSKVELTALFSCVPILLCSQLLLRITACIVV